MPSYQLLDEVLFVDGKHHNTQERIPKEIPFPHILDQRTEPYTYLKLNDNAAFIARFIVSGIKTELITEILRSEYGTEVADPKAEVDKVCKMLEDYLTTRTFKRKHHPPESIGKGEHKGGYELDCRVASIPFTFVKYPIG